MRSNGKCSKRLVGSIDRRDEFHRAFFFFRQLQSLDHHRCGRWRCCAVGHSHCHMLYLPKMQTPVDSKVRRDERSKIRHSSGFSEKNGVRIDNSSSSTNKTMNERQQQQLGEFLFRFQIESKLVICRTADRANMADQLRMKYGKNFSRLLSKILRRFRYSEGERE